MKVAFFFICLLCGLLAGMLGFIMYSGVIPFAAEQEEQKTDGTAEDMEADETKTAPLSIFSDSRGDMITEMIEAYKAEREKLDLKSVELKAMEEELKLREATLRQLIAELEQKQRDLTSKIVKVKESQRENMGIIADRTAKMDPVKAVEYLQQLDPEEAGVILSLINERITAKIFDAAVDNIKAGPNVVTQWVDVIKRMEPLE